MESDWWELGVLNLMVPCFISFNLLHICSYDIGTDTHRCYAELFTTTPFETMIFVDQSPLQNSTLDGWDFRYCNRGMNNASALASLQTTLSLSPATAHNGTIAACLSYCSHPLPTDTVTPETQAADKAFFLAEAMEGNGEWYGKLMADHTSLDWRDSIIANFGPGSGSKTPVLVIASSRSGCFPAEGPMKVVEFINQREGKYGLAQGIVVDWGGHWCYWEDPKRFDALCLRFFNDGSTE
jgi:pimeloyl-ACP methyl ester carboxylesterase